MGLKTKIINFQEILIDVINRWWRPIGCLTLVGGAFVNTVLLPLQKGLGIDLPGFALVVASFAPIVAIRTWEKLKTDPSPVIDTPGATDNTTP